MSEKVSNTPWSNFSDSDYSDEQYARACLLDRGPSAGTAKQRYSIPVREPSGTLNRNACHAAAAVLSSTGGSGSARGNKTSATPEQLSAARSKLVSLYKNALNEPVPEGLQHSLVLLGEEFLSHHGVLGMKWGVRKAAEPRAPEAHSVVPLQGKTKIKTSGGENHPAHEDAIRAALAQQKLAKSGFHALSNKELQDVANRMNLEQQVRSLHSKRPKSLGRQFIDTQLQQIQRDPIGTAAKVSTVVSKVKAA